MIVSVKRSQEVGSLKRSSIARRDISIIMMSVMKLFRLLLRSRKITREVGAILLECSDMPPYAAAVQGATNLPVFDFITLSRYAHSVVVQRPYYGFV